MVVNELVAAEHATRSQARTDDGQPRGAGGVLLRLIGRMRFQLLAGFVCAVIVPLIARSIYEPLNLSAMAADNSTLGTLGALLLGYILFRKVTGFPGVRASAYILPAFLTSYLMTVAGFFMLRLDYSRLQFIVSFALTVTLYYVVFVIARRVQRIEIAIIPGGDARRLLSLRYVNWRVPESPDQVEPGIGIAADLRADLPEAWERFIADSALSGRPVYNAKQLHESLSGRVQIEHLSENPFGSLTPNMVYASAKRYLDFALAVVALVVTGPMLLLVMLAIRLESSGPALFRQERMGFGGRPFTVFKLRTMCEETPGSEDAAEQMTQDNDPRITPLGRFLRKMRIDELPQIINIIRGEMSWIGPRPEALKLSTWYEGIIPFYRYRHVVRPGITGWAQVNQGHVTSLDDADVKLQYDFFYVKHFSLWLDILVLLRTVRVVLTGHGAK